MSNKKDIQDRVGGLSIAIGLGAVVFLVLAARMVDIPVRHDLTGVSNTASITEDWKGNSGSISHQSPTRLAQH